MPSVFVDGARPPDDLRLAEALGRTREAWDEILTHLDGIDGVARRWKYYGAKHGWQMVAARGKAAVLYLIPNDGAFTAALALRDRALDAVRAAGLPPSLVRAIETAKPYAEGRPVRIEVKTGNDAGVVAKLVAIKLAS
jgi:uncharacterized protein DUF3788